MVNKSVSFNLRLIKINLMIYDPMWLWCLFKSNVQPSRQSSLNKLRNKGFVTEPKEYCRQSQVGMIGPSCLLRQPIKIVHHEILLESWLKITPLQGCQPPCFQMLRIDGERMINGVLMHTVHDIICEQNSRKRCCWNCNIWPNWLTSHQSHYCLYHSGVLEFVRKQKLKNSSNSANYLKFHCQKVDSTRNGKLRWLSRRFQTLIWRWGEKVQNLESPGLSGRVDSPASAPRAGLGSQQPPQSQIIRICKGIDFKFNKMVYYTLCSLSVFSLA